MCNECLVMYLVCRTVRRCESAVDIQNFFGSKNTKDEIQLGIMHVTASSHRYDRSTHVQTHFQTCMCHVDAHTLICFCL